MLSERLRRHTVAIKVTESYNWQLSFRILFASLGHGSETNAEMRAANGS